MGTSRDESNLAIQLWNCFNIYKNGGISVTIAVFVQWQKLCHFNIKFYRGKLVSEKSWHARHTDRCDRHHTDNANKIKLILCIFYVSFSWRQTVDYMFANKNNESKCWVELFSDSECNVLKTMPIPKSPVQNLTHSHLFIQFVHDPILHRYPAIRDMAAKRFVM